MEICRQTIAIQRERERGKEKWKKMCERGDLSQGCWARNLFLPLIALLTWDITYSSLYSLPSWPVEKAFWTYSNEHCLCIYTLRSKGPNSPSCLVELNLSPLKSPAPPQVGTGSAGATEAWGFALPEKWRSGKQHRNAEYYYSLKHCL